MANTKQDDDLDDSTLNNIVGGSGTAAVAKPTHGEWAGMQAMPEPAAMPMHTTPHPTAGEPGPVHTQAAGHLPVIAHAEPGIHATPGAVAHPVAHGLPAEASGMWPGGGHGPAIVHHGPAAEPGGTPTPTTGAHPASHGPVAEPHGLHVPPSMLIIRETVAMAVPFHGNGLHPGGGGHGPAVAHHDPVAEPGGTPAPTTGAHPVSHGPVAEPHGLHAPPSMLTIRDTVAMAVPLHGNGLHPGGGGHGPAVVHHEPVADPHGNAHTLTGLHSIRDSVDMLVAPHPGLHPAPAHPGSPTAEPGTGSEPPQVSTKHGHMPAAHDGGPTKPNH